MGIFKQEIGEKATLHTNRMYEEYENEIRQCIKETKIYNEYNKFNENYTHKDNKFIMIPLDTVSAAALYKEKDSNSKVCVLNFASYKRPGGGFLQGATSQEECLCHESYLYNVIKAFQIIYYDKNLKELNKSLYKNRALYSPNILFEHNNEKFNCDVITCAAPNKKSAQNNCNVSSIVNIEALRSRIKFILDIMKENNVDVPIIGAFGCGVFGQNPKEVAAVFKEMLCNYDFKEVVIAIPDLSSDNYKAFNRIFGK